MKSSQKLLTNQFLYLFSKHSSLPYIHVCTEMMFQLLVRHCTQGEGTQHIHELKSSIEMLKWCRMQRLHS